MTHPPVIHSWYLVYRNQNTKWRAWRAWYAVKHNNTSLAEKN